MEILDCIGSTPLICLPCEFTQCEATILVKMEEFNLGGSIKSRVGYQMIIDAEISGRINARQPQTVTILEATGGNTGIGIAQMCALRGYNCVLTVPDNYSKIRIDLLKNMGAEVILSDHTIGNDSHIQKALNILERHPEYIYLDQTKNPSNVEAHYQGTGKEILLQSECKIDYFVAGIGSGGTITGIGKAIKEQYSSCSILGVQPQGCDIMNGQAVPHLIQGIAIGKIPDVLDKSIIDGMIDISEKDVIEMKKNISMKLGLYLGYSSVANILGALCIGKNLERNKVIVTVSPDGGRNY